MQHAAFLQGAFAAFLRGDVTCRLPAASPCPVCEALYLLRSIQVFLFHFFSLFYIAAEYKPQKHSDFSLSF